MVSKGTRRKTKASDLPSIKLASLGSTLGWGDIDILRDLLKKSDAIGVRVDTGEGIVGAGHTRGTGDVVEVGTIKETKVVLVIDVERAGDDLVDVILLDVRWLGWRRHPEEC